MISGEQLYFEASMRRGAVEPILRWHLAVREAGLMIAKGFNDMIDSMQRLTVAMTPLTTSMRALGQALAEDDFQDGSRRPR